MLAATGHATLTGELGVCCVNVEADVDQLVVGLCEARRQRAPVLAIGVSGSDGLKYGAGRADQSRKARLRGIEAPATAEQAIRRAVTAVLDEQGLAYLDIPLDQIDRTTLTRTSLPGHSQHRHQERALRG